MNIQKINNSNQEQYQKGKGKEEWIISRQRMQNQKKKSIKRKISSSQSSDRQKKKNKDRDKQKRKNKKKSHKRKKMSESDSRYSSQSSSRKKDERRRNYRQKQRKRSRSRSKQKDIDTKGKIQESRPAARPRIKINGGFLSSLIIDQKFSNRRLDEEDISKAGEKLQKNFNEKRKPVTMSQFLSNESLRLVPIKENQVKVYKCELQKCLEQFVKIEDLQRHIEKHKNEL